MKTLSPIIKPIMTEKSSRMQEGKKYSFEIIRKASKTDVKKAVEELYGVKAESVRIMLVPQKVRLLGRGREWTKRPVYKKAIVTLKGDKSIDPNKLKESKKK